ncbi:cell division control 14, SIN component [Suhomyces tanzawaensis NRRL Y-17324]|uniref:Cell division control 14, SIN component n=1 Tax=Suhomyces tanzawaensis NRRL Y-17324 TaxID=984487 RepID=A0A1E4SLY5_9ASCO|nr:cell division control 14, SIN component [Suhomyces tanzawaensis NRRL Y-17324]ODV80505.1 cell division control 14, SIN component [Suhomyces tanzawaensis NRRL Y-17324]
MEDTILDIVDLLDSTELTDVVHGIDQLDLLLSQLLPQIVAMHKRGTVTSTNSGIPDSKSLATFVALQDNFQYNLAHYLINFYKFLAKDPREVDPKAILTCNRLLQGLLLIHPSLRKLFSRLSNMRLLLVLVDQGTFSIQITISFISTLIHILLKDLKNFRIFEDNGGCSILIRKFKLASFDELPKSNSNIKVYTQQNLNFKIIEFLIFYLVDETNFKSTITPKTVAEKSALFKADFPEIDSLIENLNELNNL